MNGGPRRAEPRLHLEPPRWLARGLPATVRGATLVAFAVAIGLAWGHLAWFPAPLNGGPPPVACAEDAARSSWTAAGLTAAVESWPEGRQLVLQTVAGGERGPVVRSGRFAPEGSERACVALLPAGGDGPRVVATWADGRWAAFDQTLSRVNAPGWLARGAEATEGAPLGALALLLLGIAAWRARRPLTGWSTVGGLAAGGAALVWLPSLLEVL